MTQEEKQLLLKDLCSRLPYGVKVTTTNPAVKIGVISGISIKNKISVETKDANIVFDCTEVKPYLRPLSSMTKEEKEEMHNLLSPEGTAIYKNDGIAVPINHFGEFIPYEFMGRIIQYLLEHHFDFMELIPKGLAIEAPEGMYNIKEQ